jgi:hypothetical protein
MDGHRLRGENCVLVSGLATSGEFGSQVHSFFVLKQFGDAETREQFWLTKKQALADVLSRCIGPRCEDL